MATKAEQELRAAVGRLKSLGVTMRIEDGTAPSDADRCRANGWGPGTNLIGDKTVILITAVGERGILARQIANDGKSGSYSELAWSLSARAWREALPGEVPR